MRKSEVFCLSDLNNNGGAVMFKKLFAVLVVLSLSVFACKGEDKDEPCYGSCEANEVCVADECYTSCTTNDDCFADHGGGWVCKVVAGVGGYCAVQLSDDDTGVPGNGSNAPVCNAKPEVCDGVDNDCDGAVDEGVKNACEKCGALPKEVCDGKDNDCDGKTDEGVKNACGDCGPVPKEVCDGLDNDCDGKVPLVENDEDGDGWMVCEGDCNDLNSDVYPGAKELCNGFDDNCDGVIPENEADADLDGFRVCDGDCDDEDNFLYPGAMEYCDGGDEDCDGLTDEDYFVDVPCVGVGACGAGVYECTGWFGYQCSSMPGASEDASMPEVCGDNIDNDCNGVVDDPPCACEAGAFLPCGTSTEGQCHKGWQECLNGVWGPCVGAVEPMPELCNGKDDDCDGVIPLDEADADGDGFSVCGGDCNDANAWVYPGAPETCNGVDDDCDGPADEDFGVGVKCTGLGFCGAWQGVYECDGPDGSTCSTMPGMSADKSSPEVCSDNIDNDCDSSVDENCDCDFDPDYFKNDNVKCGVNDVGTCVIGSQACQADGKYGVCFGAKLPEAEKCDGKDNDCDGVVPADEVDVDGDGFMICEGDCNDADPAVNPDAAEKCNGIDDDCDGLTDEDYFVGAPCNGEGACGLGKIECASLTSAICSTEPKGSADESVPELCGDSLDNDCDGKVDEDCACNPGQKEPCGSNDVYPCKFGVRVCNVDGTWGDCVGNIEPLAEICDGLDTDCDAQVGVGEVDADGDGEMVCQGDCNDADPAIRSGVKELCDGVDNNCDGAIDEGYFVGVPCLGLGACAMFGQVECFTPEKSQCSTMPSCSVDLSSKEKCGDNIDNDCDGSVDEDCACDPGDEKTCGSSKVLPCQKGVQYCDALGQWGKCLDSVEPQAEVCNGVDDDCNGATLATEVDEDGDGFMACAGDCNDANAKVNPAAVEICNGVDDDCDGVKDEGFFVGAPCVSKGICGAGKLECAGSFTTVCSSGPGGSKDESLLELCGDNLDNDCDGNVDENCDCDPGDEKSCGASDVQPCKLGKQICGENGKWGACVGNLDPQPEVCNGVDDNCDGKLGVDEVDADGDGQMKCAGDCVDSNPAINSKAKELCNGVDDDCDGAVDEGYFIGVPCVGFGACGAGVYECAGQFGYQCSTMPGGTKNASTPEKCGDFTDNDCDNSVDEGCVCVPGYKQDCGSSDVLPCKLGKQTCGPDGKWGQCVGAVEPAPEICDGIDNDCDGVVPANEVDADKDGESTCAGDCNDANKAINTKAKEVCDGVDNNCDGQKDESFFVGAPCFGMGACGDGKIECNAFGIAQCSSLPGGSENKAKPEACNDFVDNDCDGVTDEGCKCVFNADEKLNPQLTCGTTDVGECAYGVQKCLITGQWGPCVGNIEPVAEKCNGLDDDCDGIVPTNEADADKDGYRVCENDCNDTFNEVNPGEKEVCDGIDNNCNKTKDEGCAFVTCNICCGFGLGHPVVWWGGDPFNSWSGDTGYCGVWTGTVQQICLRGDYPVQGYVDTGWADWNCQNGNDWGGWQATGVLWCVDQNGKDVKYEVVPGKVDPQGEGELLLLEGLCK